ncbi:MULTISPECIES: ROK family protein [unclassified Candidatus Paralachnospira]|uniref:ROK family protein n=1 Tax=unclassified Candidatus Paralachnospira TaxID=3099471 RepID=UPI003F9044D1
MEGYFIGIDVGGTNVKLMIMDEEKQVVAKTQIPTKAERGYEAVSDDMIETLDRMFEKNGIREPKIQALAMGLPGTVDRKAGETVYLAKLRWDGFNPAKKLGEYYRAPYFIENDANINALGEYAFGESGKENLLLLTLGTGVGGGIIINGKIFGGAANMAGEFGHMMVQTEGGDICLCGRRGHLEAYCSGTAMMRDALEMMKNRRKTILHQYVKENEGVYDNSMVTRGVKEGDATCREILNRFISYLAAGISTLMMLFNPEVVLIGGGVSNAGDLLIEPLNQKCREMVLSERSYCPVIRTSLGSEAGMYGACALAMQAVKEGV